jgi:hypothetical protein
VYIPTPRPVQPAPVHIVNNNTNTNVNVIPTQVSHTALQCAVYATKSTGSATKVTLSWATNGGVKTEVYCTGNVLSRNTVNTVDSGDIYPKKSTTCHIVVTGSTGNQKTCNTHITVKKDINPVVSVTNKVTHKIITLSQVPYTGFNDTIQTLMYIATILTAVYMSYAKIGIFAKIFRNESSVPGVGNDIPFV